MGRLSEFLLLLIVLTPEISVYGLIYSLRVSCSGVVTGSRLNPDHLLTRTEPAAMTSKQDHEAEIYRFSSCVVDADRRELTLAGDAVTVQPKAFELLLYLYIRLEPMPYRPYHFRY